VSIRREALFRDQFVQDFQGIADQPSAGSKKLTPPIGSMTFWSRHQIRLEKLKGNLKGFFSEETMTKTEFAPVTPGEMLKEEFLAEHRLSQNQLAKAIGISPNRITEIVNNRRRITADTALRLSLYFGNCPEFWMNLQSHYDLKMARSDLKPGDIKRIKAQRAA
jgi:antitoxin HigA-1